MFHIICPIFLLCVFTLDRWQLKTLINGVNKGRKKLRNIVFDYKFSPINLQYTHVENPVFNSFSIFVAVGPMLRLFSIVTYMYPLSSVLCFCLLQNHDAVVAIKSITKKNIAKSQNLLSKEIKILKVRLSSWLLSHRLKLKAPREQATQFHSPLRLLLFNTGGGVNNPCFDLNITIQPTLVIKYVLMSGIFFPIVFEILKR